MIGFEPDIRVGTLDVKIPVRGRGGLHPSAGRNGGSATRMNFLESHAGRRHIEPSEVIQSNLFMLVSYDAAFLFVHIDRAAGTSIQLALQPYASRRRDSRLRRRLVWLGGMNRLGQLHRVLEFPEHAPARAVKRCLPPELYARLFKFAFVRNPWDRLVSRHAHLLQNQNHPRHRLVKSLGSFENYLDWEIARQKMHQHAYVYDADGEWLVDFIGYYEHLERDFAKVCERLEIRADLPRVNTSVHRDYRSYYTAATRDLVAEHFRRDIEMFGYEFEGLRADAAPRGLVTEPADNVFC